jgi:hypothetical protein
LLKLYVTPVVGVVTVIVPVVTPHEGCMIVIVGSGAGVGCAVMIFETAVDKHVDDVVLVIIEYVPAVSAFDVADA